MSSSRRLRARVTPMGGATPETFILGSENGDSSSSSSEYELLHDYAEADRICTVVEEYLFQLSPNISLSKKEKKLDESVKIWVAKALSETICADGYVNHAQLHQMLPVIDSRSRDLFIHYIEISLRHLALVKEKEEEEASGKRKRA